MTLFFLLLRLNAKYIIKKFIVMKDFRKPTVGDILKGMSCVRTYPGLEFWGTVLKTSKFCNGDNNETEFFNEDYVNSRLNYGCRLASSVKACCFDLCGKSLEGLAAEVETMHGSRFAVFCFQQGGLDFVAVVELSSG